MFLLQLPKPLRAVRSDDAGRFAVGEAFKETLASRANCVHDRAAEESVGKDNCNGNAVDQSTAMGGSPYDAGNCRETFHFLR